MPSKLTGNLNPDVSQIKIALRGKITQPSVEKSVCSSLVLPFTATEKDANIEYETQCCKASSKWRLCTFERLRGKESRLHHPLDQTRQYL